MKKSTIGLLFIIGLCANNILAGGEEASILARAEAIQAAEAAAREARQAEEAERLTRLQHIGTTGQPGKGLGLKFHYEAPPPVRAVTEPLPELHTAPTPSPAPSGTPLPTPEPKTPPTPLPAPAPVNPPIVSHEEVKNQFEKTLLAKKEFETARGETKKAINTSIEKNSQAAQTDVNKAYEAQTKAKTKYTNELNVLKTHMENVNNTPQVQLHAKKAFIGAGGYPQRIIQHPPGH